MVARGALVKDPAAIVYESYLPDHRALHGKRRLFSHEALVMLREVRARTFVQRPPWCPRSVMPRRFCGCRAYLKLNGQRDG